MKKYKIGYATGVYDLFHIGHLIALEREKELCEHFIVGVNSDELVLEYKNKKPIVPFEERIRIVGALKCVDEVIRVDSLDKMEAWKQKHFEALFIGSDWKGTPRWNETEKIMNQVGVEVVYLPYTETTSSTLLADKLRKI